MPFPQPSQSFAWTQEPWGAALRCRPLLAVAPHLFTSAGVSVSRDRSDPALAAVTASLGLTPEALVQVHQVHGPDVVVVRNADTHLFSRSGEKVSVPISAADALVTDAPGRAVGVRIADCVPILMADRNGRAVAAVHGGWRGTAAGIVAAAVEAMRAEFGIPPGELIAAIGPAARACCYEVGPEVREVFAAAGQRNPTLAAWFSSGQGDRFFLDVPRANADQLEGAGVPREQIHDCGLCTIHSGDVFHSYRRQRGAAGRALALIGVQGSGVRA